jgi:hypothetical protein
LSYKIKFKVFKTEFEFCYGLYTVDNYTTFFPTKLNDYVECVWIISFSCGPSLGFGNLVNSHALLPKQQQNSELNPIITFPSFSKRVSLSFPSFFTLRGWARAGHLSSFAFQSSYYFFHYHFVSQKGSKKPSMRTTVAMRILLLLLGLRVLSLSFLGLRMVVAQKAAPHPETASWNRENGRWRNAMAT